MSLIQSSQLNGTANVVCDCSQQIAEGFESFHPIREALREVRMRARTWNGGIMVMSKWISSVILFAGGMEDVTTLWCLDSNCRL